MRFRSALCPLALFVLLLAFSPAQAQAQQVYVSALGSDSNSGKRNAPCRTIKYALTLVQSGGQVIILDSGDYDTFSVNKAVTIEAAPGAVAVIPANYGVAVKVNPPPSDTVVLRNLSLTVGGTYGIQCLTGTLHVDNCIISGVFNYGIYADNCRLFVKGTSVRSCNTGIFAVSSSQTPTIASIDHCQVEENGFGVRAYYNSRVSVRDTIVSGNSQRGFDSASFSGYTAELNVESCMVASNWSGIVSDNSQGGTAIVRVSNTIVVNNNNGFYAYGGTSFYSRGNNTVHGNTAADVTGTITVIRGA